MLSFAIIFCVLAALVTAAPLPMSASKSSNRLTARFYSSDVGPGFYPDAPCWQDTRFGWWRQNTCGFLNLEVGGNDWCPYPNGVWPETLSCYLDGRAGTIQNAVCVAINLNLDLKRHYFSDPVEGERCFNDKAWGHWSGGDCIADADVAVELTKRYLNGPFLVDNEPCFQDNQFGYIQNEACDLTVDVAIGGQTWFDRYGRPIVAPYYEGAPCWSAGKFGWWTEATCLLADVNVGIAKRDLLDRPVYREGDKCLNGDRWGIWHNALCVVADLDLHLKRDPQGHREGGRCLAKDGRYGQWKKDDCVLDAKLELTMKKRNYFNDGRREGAPCLMNDGRYGVVQDTVCVLLDVKVKKSFLNGVTGGNQLDSYPSYPYDDFYRSEGVDAKAIIDAPLKGNEFKRNGLFHHAPDGNEADGAVKSVVQLIDHVEARGLLGPEPAYRDRFHKAGGVAADIKAIVALNGNHPRGDDVHFKRDHFHKQGEVSADVAAAVHVTGDSHRGNGLHLRRDRFHKDGGILASVKAIVNVDGDQHRGNGLHLKRDLSHQNSGIIADVTAIVDVDGDHHRANALQLKRVIGDDGVLANVKALVDIDGDDYHHGYPHGQDGKLLGLIGKRNLGGLGGVNGLGLGDKSFLGDESGATGGLSSLVGGSGSVSKVL